MRRFAYRCFLPDLTGFTSSHCAGPNLHRRLCRPAPRRDGRMKGINPAVADCGLQGTATSPFSTAKLFGDPILNLMAEGVGFEPTRRLPVYTLSRRAPSAARTSLRNAEKKFNGGGGGIRTHEARQRLLAFEASSFNRSDTPPGRLHSSPEFTEKLLQQPSALGFSDARRHGHSVIEPLIPCDIHERTRSACPRIPSPYH